MRVTFQEKMIMYMCVLIKLSVRHDDSPQWHLFYATTMYNSREDQIKKVSHYNYLFTIFTMVNSIFDLHGSITPYHVCTNHASSHSINHPMLKRKRTILLFYPSTIGI